MGRELPPLQVRGRINLNGLERLPALVEEVVAGRRAAPVLLSAAKAG
jgi:hypothetical protein